MNPGARGGWGEGRGLQKELISVEPAPTHPRRATHMEKGGSPEQAGDAVPKTGV